MEIANKVDAITKKAVSEIRSEFLKQIQGKDTGTVVSNVESYSTADDEPMQLVTIEFGESNPDFSKAKQKKVLFDIANKINNKYDKKLKEYSSYISWREFDAGFGTGHEKRVISIDGYVNIYYIWYQLHGEDE